MQQQTQEQRINIPINLHAQYFANANGIFPAVQAGKLTDIVHCFNDSGQQLN